MIRAAISASFLRRYRPAGLELMICTVRHRHVCLCAHAGAERAHVLHLETGGYVALVGFSVVARGARVPVLICNTAFAIILDR